MSNYNKSHKITLHITDENINILDKVEKENIKGQVHLIYCGVLDVSPKVCPYCKKCEVGKNGHRKTKVKLPYISDKPAILYLNKQRFIVKIVINYLHN